METALRDKEIGQSQQLFRDTLRAQELSILQYKKSSIQGRKSAWLSKYFLVKFRDEKEMYRQWK